MMRHERPATLDVSNRIVSFRYEINRALRLCFATGILVTFIVFGVQALSENN